MGSQERGGLVAAVVFGPAEWRDEIERFASGSPARLQAERARKQIEAGRTPLTWRPCEANGPSGARLPGCRKLYLPLDREGSSAAPYGFVFQLAKTSEGLIWNFIAFGERHPDNPATRTVYERAHKRLHGHYPR